MPLSPKDLSGTSAGRTPRGNWPGSPVNGR